MNNDLRRLVEQYTDAYWWFGFPALALFGLSVILGLLGMILLSQRHRLARIAGIMALTSAIVLLWPGAAIAWEPTTALGLQTSDLTRLPTATYEAIAHELEIARQWGYFGSAALILAAVCIFGTFGNETGAPCPDCGRERHPSWQGVCPECQLLAPLVAERPLTRLNDYSLPVLATPFAVAPKREAAQVEETTQLLSDYRQTAQLRDLESARLYPLFQLDTMIGRASYNDIVLQTPTISRKHARIQFDGHEFTLVDNGSPNGTWLNERRVIGSQQLQYGQIIRLGNQEFRFEQGSTSNGQDT